MLSQNISSFTQGVSKQFTSFNPNTNQKTVNIPPNESRILVDSHETGIVSRVWFTFPGWFWRHWDEAAPVDPKVLRMTILKIYFDGSPFPSIEAPIGDFFGIGHCEYRHYTSKYLGMSSGGFYCYLPMPFDKGFRVEIENRHPEHDVEIFFNINAQILDKLDSNATRLHCAYNSGLNNGTEPLEILNTTGNGHFVGCALSIQGEPMNYLSFLEAPEYIWIDDASEVAPTIIGTGMEDYFNGGWYFRNDEFYCDTHGVPLRDTLRSMVSMYRFHEADRINFNKNIRMAFINPWESKRLKPFIFSSTSYYYLQAAQQSCYRLPDTAQLTKVYRIRDVDFQSVP